MAKKVLIVSNSQDLHADLVAPLIESKGCQVFRLDLDAFPRDYRICQVFRGGRQESHITHLPSDEMICNLADVGAIWLRKPADFSFANEDLSLQERTFAKLESEHALFGLLYPLSCYWMSHPVSLRGAMWKGEQLHRASRLGFRVPASLVTNSAAQVIEFRKSVQTDLVFKTLSVANLGSDLVAEEDCITGGVPTTLVTEEMMADLDAVNLLPCHFQEYIPKWYELRVTIIGDKLFAAKMHTQDDGRTKVDSRDMSAEIRYEATTLPAAIAQKCLEFVSSYGLTYGALDLIVTPANEYVFLENNPVGQCLFIQQLIPEFQLLDTIAETLAAQAIRRAPEYFPC